MNFGTAEHATAVTEGRHPGVQDGLQWLTFSHLAPHLQRYSEPFYEAAVALIVRIATDSPELTTAINGLIAAKDSAVRAGIRHDTGRAGSVPRPQATVDPPKLAHLCSQTGPHRAHDWTTPDGPARRCVGIDAKAPTVETVDLPPFGPDGPDLLPSNS